MKEILWVDWIKQEIFSGRKSSGQQDYHRYQWTLPEQVAALGGSIGVIFLMAVSFYRSIWAVFPLIPVGFMFYMKIWMEKKRKRGRELEYQFSECMMAVSTAMQAGYSVENALLISQKDMLLMFGQESMIGSELRVIERGLHINIPVEELLSDMAHRSDSKEIAQFAEVFVIAKKNGGNLPDIIQHTVSMIGNKIRLNQEIEAILSGKRMELLLMRIMPFFILFYLEITNPGYFDSLYHNLRGVLIMTLCMITYLGAYVLGEVVIRQLAEKTN